MSEAKLWTFEQLGGDRKLISLNGWQAPFGRPRQGRVVNVGIMMRRQVTTYSGSQVPPTIHSFGKIGKPFQLHGRWMDASIAKAGGAQVLVRNWKDFVEDEQEVRVKWGDILSYRIFIHDLDLDFESEAHVAWKMEADVLVDEAGPVIVDDRPIKHPITMATQMADLLGPAEPYTVKTFGSGNPFSSILGLLPQISDTLDTIVSAINTPFAIVFDVASALTDFESAASTDLVKMASGLEEMRNALLALRDETDVLVSGAALMNVPSPTQQVDFTSGPPSGLFSGPQILDLTSAKADSDIASTNLLALIADMQREIEGVQRGRGNRAYAAQFGDTWELIASRTMGGPGGADAIRSMNGIRFGQKPQPGRTYTIPSQA